MVYFDVHKEKNVVSSNRENDFQTCWFSFTLRSESVHLKLMSINFTGCIYVRSSFSLSSAELETFLGSAVAKVQNCAKSTSVKDKQNKKAGRCIHTRFRLLLTLLKRRNRLPFGVVAFAFDPITAWRLVAILLSSQRGKLTALHLLSYILGKNASQY